MFTYEAGTTNWYFYNLERDIILDAPGEICASIRSKPNTPRKCVTEEKTLIDLRNKIEKHIKNTYLRRIDAPVGVKLHPHWSVNTPKVGVLNVFFDFVSKID